MPACQDHPNSSYTECEGESWGSDQVRLASRRLPKDARHRASGSARQIAHGFAPAREALSSTLQATPRSGGYPHKHDRQHREAPGPNQTLFWVSPSYLSLPYEFLPQYTHETHWPPTRRSLTIRALGCPAGIANAKKIRCFCYH